MTGKGWIGVHHFPGSLNQWRYAPGKPDYFPGLVGHFGREELSREPVPPATVSSDQITCDEFGSVIERIHERLFGQMFRYLD
jgi:hypothetical protein